MTPELPTALQPWAEPLALLHPEVIAGLVPWLAVLEAVVGRPRARRTNALLAEPNGYAGLSRRGPYERLVQSEWLLAEEAPLEFLRRATTGEHVFHELAHDRPAAQPGVLVLLDAGPWQLGAPRLGHLAVLVVLGRRATHAGGELRFGVLQRPDVLLSWSKEGVRALLDARTTEPGSEAHAEPWEAMVREHALHDAERWFVGDPGDAACAAAVGATHVGVAESLAARAIEVTVRGRSVRLPLPADDVCVRALRNPFPERARPRPRPPPVGAVAPGVRLSEDGRRLLLRVGDDVVAMHAPSTANEPPGRDRVFRSAAVGPVIAATMLGSRRLWIGRAEGGSLELCDGSPRPVRIAQGLGVALGSRASREHLALVVGALGGGGAGVASQVQDASLLDVDRRLWRLWRTSPSAPREEAALQASAVANEVVSLVSCDGDVVYAYAGEHGLRVVSQRLGVQQTSGMREVVLLGFEPERHESSGGSTRVVPYAVIRIYRDADRWLAFNDANTAQWPVEDPRERAVAIHRDHDSLQLVVLEAADRCLVRRTVVGPPYDHRAASAVIVRTACEIQRWHHAAGAGRIAWQTAEEVGVYDLVRDQEVLRVRVAERGWSAANDDEASA